LRKLFARLVLFGLLAVLALAGWIGWRALTPVSVPSNEVEFSVPAGSSIRGAARQMAEAGIGIYSWEFALLARFSGRGTTVKAGNFVISRGITPWGLLGKLSRGEFTQEEVTLIEGWTLIQMREALNKHPALRHDSRDMSAAELRQYLGITDKALEGWLFPDTYLFPKGESDLKVLARAHRAMQRVLNAAWEARDPTLPLASRYEALILASIVEKETGREADRPNVASVFINRLRSDMRLQTDPTVIYGIGRDFDGNLRRSDLQRDTPWNTYTRDGLPPTPIAMPGLASLRATLGPPKTDYLYFVARGDGTSEFSSTLEAHNRAVHRFQIAPSRRINERAAKP
jgi:UPF0755 protein